MPPIREGRPCATSKGALIRLRRSPAEYACCDRPISGRDGEERVLGCGNWNDCDIRSGAANEMTKRGFAVNGPRNRGVRIMKVNDSGPGVREVIMPCYAIALMRTEVEDNGGILEIIAEEGEYLEHGRGSVYVAPDPAKGELVGHMEDKEDVRLLVVEHPRDESYGGLKTMATIERMKESDARRKREQKREQFMGEPLKEDSVAEAEVAKPEPISAGGGSKPGGGKGPKVSSELGRSA